MGSGVIHPVDVTDAVVLRVSDLVAWEGCKRKWWWGQHYTQHHFVPAFMIGSGVHAGLAAYYANDRSYDHAMRTVTTWITDYKRAFEDMFPLDRWDEAGCDDHANLIVGMVDNFIATDTLRGEVVIDDEGPIVERRMTVPILDVDGTPIMYHGRPVFLSGQCDVALRRGPATYIVDHKTFSARTLADGVDAGLEVDEQLTAYVYLYYRTWGQVPTAAIYNVLVKEVPRPPKVLANGQLSKDKSQATTGALFRAELRDRGLPITPYLDFLAYLDAQTAGRYVQHWQSSRNMHELATFERKIAYRVHDILRLIDNPDAYAQSSGSSYRCGRCDFISPCKAADDGGDPIPLLENHKEKVLWQIDQ